MAIYELDPVDRIAVAAIGEPGRRQFFLQATGSGRTLTLGCETAQIQALLVRVSQMLQAHHIASPDDPALAAGETPERTAPGEPEWQLAASRLTSHGARLAAVRVASH